MTSSPKNIDQKEQQRLDKLRNEKFKQYHDLMAQHRIEESLSELSSSIISNEQRMNSAKFKNIRRSSCYTNEQVLEEENEEESDLSRNLSKQKRQNNNKKKGEQDVPTIIRKQQKWGGLASE